MFSLFLDPQVMNTKINKHIYSKTDTCHQPQNAAKRGRACADPKGSARGSDRLRLRG